MSWAAEQAGPHSLHYYYSLPQEELPWPNCAQSSVSPDQLWVGYWNPLERNFGQTSPGLHGWDMLWERARVEGIESFLGGTGGGLWLSTRGGGGGAAADELPRRGGRGGGVLRISGCSRGSEGNCITLVWLGLELGSVKKVKWKLADIIHAVKNQGLIMPWRNIPVKVTAVACFTVAEALTIVHVIQFWNLLYQHSVEINTCFKPRFRSFISSIKKSFTAVSLCFDIMIFVVQL